jgi:hypothetical protein
MSIGVAEEVILEGRGVWDDLGKSGYAGSPLSSRRGSAGSGGISQSSPSKRSGSVRWRVTASFLGHDSHEKETLRGFLWKERGCRQGGSTGVATGVLSLVSRPLALAAGL